MVEDVLDIRKYQNIKLPCGQPTFSTDESPFTQANPTTSSNSDNNNKSVVGVDPNVTVPDGILRITRKQKSKQTICTTSIINSDVYFIELGNISIHEPRTIKLSLSNENPVRIPIDIEFSSHSVCFCYESSWPIGLKDEEAATHHISATRGRSFEEARNQTPRCTCKDPFGNISSTQNVSRGEPTISDAKKAKPSYHSLFSLTFSSPLMNMYLQRTPTKASFKPYQSSYNESQIELASENLPLPSTVLHTNSSIRCERQMIKVIVGSQYQKIQLNVFFTGTEGRLVTTVAADDKSSGGQFYFGTDTMLKLSTMSTFEEYVKDPQFSLSGEDFSLVFTSSLNNKAFNRIKPGSVVSYSIFPSHLNICGGSKNSSNQNSNILSNDFIGNAMSLWGCSYELLRRWNYSLQSSGVLLDELRYLSSAIMDLEAPASAYQIRLRLKKKWLSSFRSGIPLPPTKLLIQSSQTRHVYHIHNSTVQSPLALMPDIYSIDLPTSRMGDFTWFYIEVYNPFKFPISFSIRESAGKSTFRKQTMSSLNFTELDSSSSSASVTSLVINSDGLERNIEDADLSKTGLDTLVEDENQGRIVSAASEGSQAFSFFGRKSSPSDASARSDAPRNVKEAVKMQENLKDRTFHLNRDSHHHSNRRFAIIQGATLHSQSPRLRKTGKAENGEFLSPTTDSPYVVHSLSSTEWVALPYAKSRIGPIIINPKADSRSGVFYIFNNFTGFDKVEVRTSFGNSKLIVSDAFSSSPPCDTLCSL